MKQEFKETFPPGLREEYAPITKFLLEGGLLVSCAMLMMAVTALTPAGPLIAGIVGALAAFLLIGYAVHKYMRHNEEPKAGQIIADTATYIIYGKQQEEVFFKPRQQLAVLSAGVLVLAAILPLVFGLPGVGVGLFIAAAVLMGVERLLEVSDKSKTGNLPEAYPALTGAITKTSEAIEKLAPDDKFITRWLLKHFNKFDQKMCEKFDWLLGNEHPVVNFAHGAQKEAESGWDKFKHGVSNLFKHDKGLD